MSGFDLALTDAATSSGEATFEGTSDGMPVAPVPAGRPPAVKGVPAARRMPAGPGASTAGLSSPASILMAIHHPESITTAADAWPTGLLPSSRTPDRTAGDGVVAQAFEPVAAIREPAKTVVQPGVHDARALLDLIGRSPPPVAGDPPADRESQAIDRGNGPPYPSLTRQHGESPSMPYRPVSWEQTSAMHASVGRTTRAIRRPRDPR